MSNITIVLAADTGYAEQVHTLMKSVCTHNTNVNFYLMHNTFRREWIDYTNQKLAASGSRLNDVKIEVDFSQYRRLSHISDAAFFRLMMQHLPVDRALYLDSDMVVTQPLHDLFNLDMRGYPVAAVQDSVLARTEWEHPIDLHTTPISIQVCCWPTWRNGGNRILRRNCCKLLPPLTNPFPTATNAF